MTINTSKELTLCGQPLLLAEFQFVDGSYLRLSSRALATTYAGQTWEPRLLDQNIAGIQMMSDQGFDLVPAVALTIADADGSIWGQWERRIGFKGAKLRLRLTLYDSASGTFSEDERVVFTGIAQAPETTDRVLRVTAKSRMSMSRTELPVLRIQRKCPWIFPMTAAQRQAAADDPGSDFYRCGYSPDAAGANARGNPAPNGQPFTSCQYTFDDCLARLGS